jgi:hypothetical protein
MSQLLFKKICSLLKPKSFLAIAIVLISSFLSSSGAVQAARPTCAAAYSGFRLTGNFPTVVYENSPVGPAAITVSALLPNKSYTVECWGAGAVTNIPAKLHEVTGTTDSSGTMKVTVGSNEECFKNYKVGWGGNDSAQPRHLDIVGNGGDCRAIDYELQSFVSGLQCNSSNIQVQVGGKKVGCVETGEEFDYTVNGIKMKSGQACENPLSVTNQPIIIQTKNTKEGGKEDFIRLDRSCNASGTLHVDDSGSVSGKSLELTIVDKDHVPICSKTIPIKTTCTEEERNRDPDANINVQPFQICDQIEKSTKAYNRCVRCVAGMPLDDSPITTAFPETPKGIWTAVGCIKTEPQNIITALIRIGLSVAGGVALLMILSASFMLSLSAGDQKKTSDAREMISSAVIGLIFIIMSVSILQFIGIELLHIPGFGE